MQIELWRPTLASSDLHMYAAHHSTEGLMPPYWNFKTQVDSLNFQFTSRSAK